MSLSDYVDVPSGGEAQDNDDVTVDDTEGGTPLLEANPHRKSALIINVGGQSIRVTTDGSAPTTTHGKLILAGGALSLSSPHCPTGAVKAICSEGLTTTVNASEVS